MGDFDRQVVDRDGVRIAAWVAGEGHPVVLLHGYPQTHLMWRHVAADLVRDRRVVAIDLRGYGESDAPPPAAGDATYAKREMALDVAHVMRELGHDRFDVVGHDRGGRVGHRLGLDHPERVRTLAVLDIVPTLHMFENVDRSMAESYFHWFFLTQPGGLPERLIEADPAAWIASRFAGRHAGSPPVDDQIQAAYLEGFRRPGVIAATCADYRAAATIDLEHDRTDRGSALSMPVLALWGESSYVGRSFDVLDVWREYAADVSGGSVAADHYLAEEAPAATVEAIRAFWGSAA
jgi:haloacetate dehalogenase